MTMIDTTPKSVPLNDQLLPGWHEVDDGFWVASENGRFLGTVERQAADRYFARDSVRAYVGEFRTLSVACAAVRGHRSQQ